MIFQITCCLLVVDQFRDGRVVTAELAVMVRTGADLAEIHRLGIECEELIGEKLAYSCDVFQGLGCLNGAEHSSDGSKYSGLRTGRHEIWWWWGAEHTTVAG